MVRVAVLPLILVASMAVTAVSAGPTGQPSSGEQDVVQASTLKRTHSVPPTWPQSAGAGVEGWVLLWFTVQPDGSVTDVEVKHSDPANVFDASAVEALRQWKFEPVERDGKKIAQRAEIRMKYARSK
jgi:TonB family protein